MSLGSSTDEDVRLRPIPKSATWVESPCRSKCVQAHHLPFPLGRAQAAGEVRVAGLVDTGRPDRIIIHNGVGRELLMPGRHQCVGQITGSRHDDVPASAIDTRLQHGQRQHLRSGLGGQHQIQLIRLPRNGT